MNFKNKKGILKTPAITSVNSTTVCSTAVDNGWDSGIKTVKNCGLCEAKPTISIVWSVYNNILAMCRHLKNIEWLGYLIGKYEEADDLYIVTGIFVPTQEVDGTSVENIENVNHIQGIIGTVHSHHHMGAFFSGTDEHHIGANHDVMIVVSEAAKTKQQVRKKLPCGHYTTVEANLMVYNPDDKESQEFVKNNISKLREAPARQPNYPFSGDFWGDGMFGYFGDEEGITYPYGRNAFHGRAYNQNAHPNPNHGRGVKSQGYSGKYANIGGRIVELEADEAAPKLTQQGSEFNGEGIFSSEE